MALAAAVAFACTPMAVWDGDGPIWCAEGPRVRLAAIAAREHDETCRLRQPCPRTSGAAARDNLVRLLGGPRGRRRDGHVIVAGPRLSCRAIGQSHQRAVAWCALPGGRDLSCEQVRAGVALRWRRYGGAAVCRKAVGA